MTTPQENPKDRIKQDIIDSEGEPITSDFKPLAIGETAIWYLISDETIKQGGSIKIEGQLVMPANKFFGAIFHFQVTYPDGKKLDLPMHFIANSREFVVTPFPADTDDEDDDLIREYPTRTLMPGGMEIHNVLYYEKRN